MERLTRRVYLGMGATDDSPPYERRFVSYEDGNFIGHEAKHMTVKEVQKCLDKLADYEDLDERGMVIRDGDPVKCFANITFDKNDLQKMVNEKISEIELNIDAIKKEAEKEVMKKYLAVAIAFEESQNKIIDEFVKTLHSYAFSNEYGTHIVFTPEQLDEMVAHWKAGEK